MKTLKHKWLFNDFGWVYIIPFVGFLNALGIQWLSRTSVLKYDDWNLYESVLKQLFSGSISWKYLWSQYGEARPLLQRLLILAEFKATGQICTMFTMIISEVMALGSVLLIVRHLKSILLPGHRTVLCILVILTSTLVDTPINIDQIQWGALFCYKGIFLGTILACCTAARHNLYVSRFSFWLGILLAFATHGYWVLLVPLFVSFSVYRWLVDTERRNEILLKNLGIFLPTMAGLAYLFFTVHYSLNTMASNSFSQFFNAPSRWFYLFFGTLANPFHFAFSAPSIDITSLSLGIMTVLGMIGALFCGCALVRSVFSKKERLDNLFVMFILSGFMFALTLMLGRGQLTDGYYPVVVYHYVILFVPFWIAFFWIALSHAEKSWTGIASYVMTILTVFFLINAISAGTQYNQNTIREIKKSGLLLMEAVNKEEAEGLRLLAQNAIHPNPKLLLKSTRWMKEKNVLPVPVP